MATLSELTFQLTDSGVVLNSDVLLNTPYVDIQQVSGLDNAPYRETKRDHEGTDGGFMDAEFEQGRDITLEGVVYAPSGTSIESYLDSLKENWAPSSSLVPLFVMADNTVGLRYVNVKPLGCKYNWETARRLGVTNVQFNCYAEDPRLYTYSATDVIIPVGAFIYTGFGFNLGFSFGFGGASSDTDGQYVTVGGNRPTPPLLTINGPVVNPVIYNDTVGKFMTFAITLNDGDQLQIDTKTHTVRLGGSANRRNTLTNAGWFMLQPGQNFMRFRAESGTGSLEVFYHDAWR